MEEEVAAQKLRLLLQPCRCSDAMEAIQKHFHSIVARSLFLLSGFSAQHRPILKRIHSLSLFALVENCSKRRR